MASASSSAARSFIRDRKSIANILLCGRTSNLTETVKKSTGPAIRSLLRFDQTPASQYPVFSETFPVMQFGFCVNFIQQEVLSERIRNMEAGHGKGVVDNADGDSKEETDFDDVDFDDDAEIENIDEDDDEEEEEDKYARKK